MKVLAVMPNCRQIFARSRAELDALVRSRSNGGSVHFVLGWSCESQILSPTVERLSVLVIDFNAVRSIEYESMESDGFLFFQFPVEPYRSLCVVNDSILMDNFLSRPFELIDAFEILVINDRNLALS